MLAHGEQAGTNLAIGGDAHPATVSAEGMRHGSDDADLTDAVLENVAPGGFAAHVSDFAQGHEFGHAAQDLVERDHDLGGPHAIFFQGHELDKADGDTLLPREA